MNTTLKKALYESIVKNISKDIQKVLNEAENTSINIKSPNKFFVNLLKHILNINPSIPNFVKSEKYNKIIAAKAAPYIVEARCIEFVEKLLNTPNLSEDYDNIDFTSDKINIEIKSSLINNHVNHKITKTQAHEILKNNAFILIPKYSLNNNKISIQKIGVKFPKRLSEFYRNDHIYYEGEFFDLNNLNEFSIYKVINPILYSGIEQIFEKYGEQHIISIQLHEGKYKEIRNTEEFFNNIKQLSSPFSITDLTYISELEMFPRDFQTNRIPIGIYGDSYSTIFLKIE